MESSNRVTYAIDLVFCIDATGSMGPVIDLVKNNALSFHRNLEEAMAKKNKRMQNLRIRLIVFRDYLADGEKAMLATKFFSLPEDTMTFNACVSDISAQGGGDEPEDGLEALAFAIKSDWERQATKKRQVIVVWTDASTHELGFGRSAPNYPEKMCRSFSELTNWWGDVECPGYMDPYAKRLILFSPDEPWWKTISDNWENVVHYPSKAGMGMHEYNYSQIIDAIVNSI